MDFHRSLLCGLHGALCVCVLDSTSGGPLHSGSEVVHGSSTVLSDVPVLGLYQTPGGGEGALIGDHPCSCSPAHLPPPAGGKLVVYGDSNCLDSAHMQRGKPRQPLNPDPAW